MELKNWEELLTQITSNETAIALFNDSGVNGHITCKWSETGKGIEKWHKILVIAEGKMSLLRVAVSLCTSMIERMK